MDIGSTLSDTFAFLSFAEYMFNVILCIKHYSSLLLSNRGKGVFVLGVS